MENRVQQYQTKKKIFFCNDQRVFWKKFSVFFLTTFLIIFTMTMFCVFDLPYLTQRSFFALPVIPGVLFFLAISSLFKTSFSDPGILPRANIREVIERDQNFNIFSNTEWTPPRIKLIKIFGQIIKLKYCFTCCLFRPPRSSHCSICDCCILNFDHHCPWIGNCIGLRNYRYFYFFILNLSLLDLFMIISVVIHLILLTDEKGTLIEAIKFSPSSIFIALINFLSIWSIVGLSGFHTYLLSINQTTNEDIKETFNTKVNSTIRNPYSKHNVIENFFLTLFRPEMPSLIKYQNISDSVVEIEVNLFKKLNTLQNNIISQLATHENMNDKNPNVSLQKNKNDQKYIDRMDTLTKNEAS